MRVLETRRPGAGIRATGVEDHRTQPARGQHLLCPQHRSGLDLVAGEHSGGRVIRALVEDQRKVEVAGRLDTGGHPRGTKTGRGGNALRMQ
jgi:hypothetical protein